MRISDPQFFLPAILIHSLGAALCVGGNQELVEQKTADLKSINEQVAKQAAPAGLKEGATVEVKATLRVERTPGSVPVLRDVKVERVTVSGDAGAVPAKPAVPASGSEKIREAGVTGKQPVEDKPGYRQERLDVPVLVAGQPGDKSQRIEAEKSIPVPVVAEEKPAAEGTPGFRQERLNVPSVSEKRKE